jgi:hypothetical protein
MLASFLGNSMAVRVRGAFCPRCARLLYCLELSDGGQWKPVGAHIMQDDQGHFAVCVVCESQIALRKLLGAGEYFEVDRENPYRRSRTGGPSSPS